MGKKIGTYGRKWPTVRNGRNLSKASLDQMPQFFCLQFRRSVGFGYLSNTNSLFSAGESVLGKILDSHTKLPGHTLGRYRYLHSIGTYLIKVRVFYYSPWHWKRWIHSRTLRCQSDIITYSIPTLSMFHNHTFILTSNVPDPLGPSHASGFPDPDPFGFQAAEPSKNSRIKRKFSNYE